MTTGSSLLLATAAVAALAAGCAQGSQNIQRLTEIRELQPGRKTSFTWVVYNEDGRDSLFWCVPPTKHSPKPQCLKVQMMEVKATQTICIPEEEEEEEGGTGKKSGKR